MSPTKPNGPPPFPYFRVFKNPARLWQVELRYPRITHQVCDFGEGPKTWLHQSSASRFAHGHAAKYFNGMNVWLDNEA